MKLYTLNFEINVYFSLPLTYTVLLIYLSTFFIYSTVYFRNPKAVHDTVSPIKMLTFIDLQVVDFIYMMIENDIIR